MDGLCLNNFTVAFLNNFSMIPWDETTPIFIQLLCGLNFYRKGSFTLSGIVIRLFLAEAVLLLEVLLL